MAVRGTHLLQFWKHPALEPEAIHSLLQVPDDIAHLMKTKQPGNLRVVRRMI